MFSTRPELAGTFGMVATTHWLATAAGMAVLEAGGTAFDAAAAAGFTLHVVEPHLNGPGGEVPAIFASASDPTPTVLCGQGVAPAGATVAHYRDELGLPAVPGTMRLRDVLGYAIGYAEGGHPAHPRVVDAISTMADHFRSAWPTSAEVWLPG